MKRLHLKSRSYLIAFLFLTEDNTISLSLTVFFIKKKKITFFHKKDVFL